MMTEDRMSGTKEGAASKEIPAEYQIRPAIFCKGKVLLLQQAQLEEGFTFVVPQWELPRLHTGGTRSVGFDDVVSLVKCDLHINVEAYRKLEKHTHPESGRFGGVVKFCEMTFLCRVSSDEVKINYDPQRYQGFAWVDIKTLKENPKEWPLDAWTKVALFEKMKRKK